MNGWTNYETWSCYVWLTNDQGNYCYLMELVEEARGEKFPAVYLSARLKDMMEEGRPALNTNVYSDLLTHAINSVNYREIADSLLSE